jgi:hypothetical protein
MVIKNKRGWIKVLEVFVAILLMTGVIVVVLGNMTPNKNLSREVSNMENSILKEIQLNPQMREAILGASVPSEWDNFNSSSLLIVKDKINNEKYASLECKAKICSLNDLCSLDNNINKNIYAESIVIASDIDTYSPRQLKIFCWEK